MQAAKRCTYNPDVLCLFRNGLAVWSRLHVWIPFAVVQIVASVVVGIVNYAVDVTLSWMLCAIFAPVVMLSGFSCASRASGNAGSPLAVSHLLQNKGRIAKITLFSALPAFVVASLLSDLLDAGPIPTANIWGSLGVAYGLGSLRILLAIACALSFQGVLRDVYSLLDTRRLVETNIKERGARAYRDFQKVWRSVVLAAGALWMIGMVIATSFPWFLTIHTMLLLSLVFVLLRSFYDFITTVIKEGEDKQAGVLINSQAAP